PHSRRRAIGAGSDRRRLQHLQPGQFPIAERDVRDGRDAERELRPSDRRRRSAADSIRTQTVVLMREMGRMRWMALHFSVSHFSVRLSILFLEKIETSDNEWRSVNVEESRCPKGTVS